MRLFGALLCLGVVSCSSPQESPAMRYQHWLADGHQGQVAAYAAFLHAERLDQVIPLPQLLRSGRRWHRCGVAEFVVPPREDWQAMAPTLRLVAELKVAGILTEVQVASAWRDPAFNRCEGGSRQSRHLRNNALDFDVGNSGVDARTLCAFWHRLGPTRKFGLGFYSNTRIHVDTAGFRTWGSDHHSGSSLCIRGTDPDTPPRR